MTKTKTVQTQRRKLDLYTTNQALVGPVLDLIRPRGHKLGTVLECCAGPGAIADAMRQRAGVERVFTNDINPEYSTDFVGDAGSLLAPVWHAYAYDLTITNPPFGLAEKILPIAFEHSTVGVAFLLRITYAEPCKGRAEWLIDHADQMRYFMPVNPRPLFRKGEINPRTGREYPSDNATVAWFVWLKAWSWRAQGIEPPFQFLTEWK